MGSTRAEPRVLAQLTELTILWNNSQMHRECPGKTTPELLSAYGKWWQDGHLERTLCHRHVFTISKTTKAWCLKKTPLVEDLYWNSCGRQGARSLVQKCLLVRVRTWSPSPVWGGGMGENQAGWVHDTSNTRIRLVCIMQFTLIRIRFVWGKNLYLENVVTFRRNSYYSKLPSGCGQF